MSSSISAARLARLIPDGDLPRPAYRSLARALRTLLADGRIPSGTRLPSERDLTLALGCSRTTVTRAYAVLRDDGYLNSRRGAGSVLSLPDRRMLDRASRVLSPGRDLDPGVIDLSCAATRAPAGIADAMAAAVAQLPAHLADNGYAPVGLPELREVLAERYRRRGLPTSPEQILVTSGAVAGLAIVSRALVRAGARVLVEDPTYPNALESLVRSGARLETIPVDPEGWDLAEAERTIAASRSRLAYLIPDFHNPTGSLLDADGRARLAAALRAAGTVPVVDETIADIDLRPAGSPPMPPPFAVHAPEAITLGSAAKSFWGGLRIGWMRVPAALAERLLDARATLDLGAPIVEQLALTEMLRRWPGLPDGRAAELIAAREATVSALRRRMPAARLIPPPGGLSLWIEHDAIAAGPIAEAAAERGLVIAPGPRFTATGGHERFFRLPYVHAPDVMVVAVDRLASAAEAVVDAGSTAVSGERPTRPRRARFVA